MLEKVKIAVSILAMVFYVLAPGNSAEDRVHLVVVLQRCRVRRFQFGWS